MLLLVKEERKKMRALIKSVNLIGDALYISPALRAWLRHNPMCDEITLHTLCDHITPLYKGMVRDFPKVHVETIFHEPPPDEHFDFRHTFDVTEAFALSDKKKQHIAQSYAELLGVEIASLKPTYITEDAIEDKDDFHWFQSLEGCILLSMFSASCTSRDPKFHGVPNKMIPWHKWKPMIELLRKEFPIAVIRYLGAPTDRPPVEFDTWLLEHDIEPMTGIPLNRLAVIMRKAKLLVTIDNGMGHLAASQETPTYLMYPRCLGTHYIVPVGNPNLLTYVHMHPPTVSPNQLKFGLEYSIRKLKELAGG